MASGHAYESPTGLSHPQAFFILWCRTLSLSHTHRQTQRHPYLPAARAGLLLVSIGVQICNRGVNEMLCCLTHALFCFCSAMPVTPASLDEEANCAFASENEAIGDALVRTGLRGRRAVRHLHTVYARKTRNRSTSQCCVGLAFREISFKTNVMAGSKTVTWGSDISSCIFHFL